MYAAFAYDVFARLLMMAFYGSSLKARRGGYAA